MKIKLNRSQISNLNKIVNHFTEVNDFTIKVDNANGIGSGICVKFNLFEKNKTMIDITDYSKW